MTLAVGLDSKKLQAVREDFASYLSKIEMDGGKVTQARLNSMAQSVGTIIQVDPKAILSVYTKMLDEEGIDLSPPPAKSRRGKAAASPPD